MTRTGKRARRGLKLAMSSNRTATPIPQFASACHTATIGSTFEWIKNSGDTRMRHVLSAVVQNQPGVLAHVAGMLASRGFNIDSLAVGETEDPHLSRMTFVVNGDDLVLEQVRKQLDKVVTVVQVQDISSENYVERDLML